jgi:hypothetical protein
MVMTGVLLETTSVAVGAAADQSSSVWSTKGNSRCAGIWEAAGFFAAVLPCVRASVQVCAPTLSLSLFPFTHSLNCFAFSARAVSRSRLVAASAGSGQCEPHRQGILFIL